jgi:hypothetical protein
MKYLLLIAAKPQTHFTEAQAAEALTAEFNELTDQLSAQGELIAAERLTGSDVATSVRVRAGVTTLADSPWAQTEEELCGFLLVRVPDLDGALAVAARVPDARCGVVEIRPIASW